MDLRGADLREANFDGANLSRARFNNANLTLANLKDADLSEADLSKANLNDADLSRATFAKAHFFETFFGNVNLSLVKGLDRCDQSGPSTIDHRTLAKSGPLPMKFLYGCGLADWQIEEAKILNPDLSPNEITDIMYRVVELRSANPIQTHNLFISYSHADGTFVDALEPKLEASGILYWRDRHDMTAGRMDRVVEHGMRQNPVVLLVLSKVSTKSDWVQHEVTLAAKLRHELGRDTLCPVALDVSWKTCDWPGPIRTQIESFNILDFSEWQKPEILESQFRKLIKGLDLFYKRSNEREE